MGNASSSGRGHHDDTVDLGYLVPYGIYTGPRDWNQAVVSQLICARRLAPFYRPLEDYEDSWDDDQIFAARKELPPPEPTDSAEAIPRIDSAASTPKSNHKRPGSLKEPSRPEAAVYRGAVECPICFLYYPPNINHSRCCDQAICTECFVQIKRAEPTPTHLVSEPAACPYCVQDNFGIVYKPPPWRAGIGCDSSSFWGESLRTSPLNNESPPRPTHKRRQKSYGADSPEVVLIDHIRPDWEAKLTAVKAAVARRANRRIIMRQVGDRLIPVGITSGRVHPISPEEAQSEGAENGPGRRSRRHRQNNQQLDQIMGMTGQDLEELMLMEAMRLSLIDHEEHQRKEAEEKKKQAAALAALETESPAAGPSSAPPPSSSRDHSPSVSTSSIAVPIPYHHPRDFLSVPGASSTSSSFCRSVTPSPSTSPLSGSPAHGLGPPSSFSRRTPSPAPFSTLTAAVSAAPTASAIFARDNADVATSSNSTSDIRTTNTVCRPLSAENQVKHPHRSGSCEHSSTDPPPPPMAPFV